MKTVFQHETFKLFNSLKFTVMLLSSFYSNLKITTVTLTKKNVLIC